MNLTTLRRSRAFQPASVLLTLVFIFQIMAPGALYAQSQPELMGFKPMGANNMVDPFTGDFSYNLPLLHVPGPGGGYPINMAYQGGVTMGQEASWVGLGWSLNVGTINRQVRGLPDEFDGQQKVSKTQHTKPDQTISVDLGLKWSEVFGADLDKFQLDFNAAEASVMVGYNNYNGWNVVPGISLETEITKKEKGAAQTTDKPSEPSANNGDSDSQSSSQTSAAKQVKSQANKEKKISEKTRRRLGKIAYGYNQYLSAGMSFNNLRGTASYVSMPRRKVSGSFSGKLGSVKIGTTADVTYTAAYTASWIASEPQNMPAYGYNHLEKAKSIDDKVLMDFQRAHDGLINTTSQMLPMPVATYDMFFVNAHGLGGSMRGIRNDIPVFKDPKFRENTGSIGGNYEGNVSTTSEVKIGWGVNAYGITNYSGPWKDYPSALQTVMEEEIPADQKLYEPVAYKFSNEVTSNSWSFALDNDHAQKFNMKGEYKNAQFKPTLTSQLGTHLGNDGFFTDGDAYRPLRNKRVKNVQFFSQGEAEKLYGSAAFGRTIDAAGAVAVSYGPQYHIDASQRIFDSHIGEIQITQGAGVKYKFGIPAYTRVKEEVVYATESTNSSDALVGSVDYAAAEDKQANGVGRDAYYSKVETPIHPHAFLLTEILSEDYVDMGTDGPTVDDLGEYVKFSYERKYTNFGSRSTMGGESQFNPGHLSDPNDDKATYTYTEKDIYYVQEIRTKTHVAQFNRSAVARTDGKSVNRDGSTGSKTMDKLESIELYLLDENGNAAGDPIKTVHFEYYPDAAAIGGGAGNSNGSRLTLKRVYFSYGDQGVSKTKSNLSSYEFTYDNGASFNQEFLDRWGNFQHVADNPLGSNVLQPYAQQQDRAKSDAAASMWNLTGIKTPSGAEFTIEYESDDYQYVQDHKATRMFEVVGFSSSPTGDASDVSMELTDVNQYLIFKLDPSLASSGDDFTKYFEGQDEVYFKVLTRLKKTETSMDVNDQFKVPAPGLFGGNHVVDYVEGYADVEGCQLFSAQDGYGSLKLKKAKVPGITDDLHPVRLAAINYLRLSRPDLIYMISGFSFGNTTAFAQNLPIIYKSVNDLVKGVVNQVKDGMYIDRAIAKNYGSQMYDGDSELKSIVRLNEVDGVKVGGGSRVKSITLSDSWGAMTGSNEATSQYTTYYEYTLEDGTSSGVASWEPGQGNEENALIRPLRYSQSFNMFFKDNAMIQELPIGHTLYPAPKVGYSRVVSYQNNDVNSPRDFGTGIQEFEYYTAKDYPFFGEKTNVERLMETPTRKGLKFVGVKSHLYDGYSQGYSVHMNDMHGKLKSSSTYESSKLGNLESPATRTEYFYRTQGGYEVGKANVLDSEVPVLTGHAQGGTAYIGKEVEMCMDMRETSTITAGAGVNTNVQTLPFGATLPTFFPDISADKSGTRTAVFTKVVTQTAVLDYVKTERNGAMAVTQNESFDPETGEALLTSVNNEYGKRIYSYHIPGHWYYDALKGAYNNIGYMFNYNPNTWATSGIADNLVSGDVLMHLHTGERYWVDKRNGIVFTNESNAQLDPSIQGVLQTGEYKVIQSGYDNMQQAKVGGLSAMINPADPNSVNHPFLDNLNDHFPLVPGSNKISMINCADGRPINKQQWYAHAGVVGQHIPSSISNSILKMYPGRSAVVISNHVNEASNCWIAMVFPQNFSGDIGDYVDYRVVGTDVATATYQPTGSKVTLELLKSDEMACDMTYCLDGVINASAIEYTDDILMATNEYVSGSITSSDVNINPYRYGARGIWRPIENYGYFKGRTQHEDPTYQETRIFEDGTYDGFVLYNWGSGNNFNWRNAQEITQLDLLGNTVEVENTLGIKSSNLYGYCSDLLVAQAQNASYDEIAFKSFEDENQSCPGAHGHMSYSGDATVSTDYAHTGSQSLKITSATQIDFDLDLITDRQYIIRYWKRQGTADMTLTAGYNSTAPVYSQIAGPIDGWVQVEISFFSNGNDPVLSGAAGTDQYIDDLRLQPFDAAMVTNVYDANTLLLTAVLDDNNFAKVYLYDNEQNLEQVKVETVEGIQTVQLNQTHIKQD